MFKNSVLTAVVAAIAAAHTSNAALVAYFPLNDGAAGTTASSIDDVIDDASHPVTDGTPNNNNATWVNDATRGIVLNSPDGNRFLAGTQGISMADGFTWTLWVNVDSSTGASDSIIGTRNGSWHKVTPGSGVDSGGFADFASGDYDIADNTWHFIAYRGSSDLGLVEMFIDGVKVGQDTSVPATYDGQMEIGGSTRFSEYATVLMDDVAIWDEALSDEDLTALLNGADPTSIPEPGSLALLGLGGLFMAARRRRG